MFLKSKKVEWSRLIEETEDRMDGQYAFLDAVGDK